MTIKNMTLADVLSLLCNSDRVVIRENKEVMAKGWAIDIKTKTPEETLSKEATALRCICETRHKSWKEKGLMAPMMPEQTPEYSFKDMEVRVYYEIHI